MARRADDGLAEASERLARQGWAVVEAVVPPEWIEAAVAAADRMFPPGPSFAADPAAHAGVAGDPFAGLRLWPTGVAELDDLVVAEPVLEVVRRCLPTPDLRLLRAGVQAKYTGAADYEQVLHHDYPNHSLVVPAPDDILGFFLYLSDVGDGCGATALVSDEVAGPVDAGATHLPPGHELYDHEQPATGAAGSLLVYRSMTYHRGTAMTRPGARRLTLSFAYGVGAPWHGWASWPRLGEDAGLRALVARTRPDVLPLLGFPVATDPYWTAETVALVGERYPGLDLARYLGGE